jgi:hypothetical protein
VLKITEIERLLGLGLTSRVISRALGVSRNTVKAVRESKFEISKETPEISEGQAPRWVDLVPWENIHREVLAGVTLYVLWGEEVENGRVPVQYPAFWKQYEKR